jgi:hypothetical protein
MTRILKQFNWIVLSNLSMPNSKHCIKRNGSVKIIYKLCSSGSGHRFNYHVYTVCQKRTKMVIFLFIEDSHLTIIAQLSRSITSTFIQGFLSIDGSIKQWWLHATTRCVRCSKRCTLAKNTSSCLQHSPWISSHEAWSYSNGIESISHTFMSEWSTRTNNKWYDWSIDSLSITSSLIF